MNKYQKCFTGIAFIVIVLTLLPGFQSNSERDLVYDLLNERNLVLERAYYGKITYETAEAALYQVETQPLLKEDLNNLKNLEITELDQIRSMNIKELSRKMKMFDMLTYHVTIQWFMTGLEGDYETTIDYHMVVRENNGSYKIAEFEPLD